MVPRMRCAPMRALTPSQTDAYLRRIDAPRPERPDVAPLATLQLAHLLRVPFENLDIKRGVPVVLDPVTIFEKLVDRGRGGYCYELNSAFGALLGALGYEVTLVSARVAGDRGRLKQEFGHMALVVRARDSQEPMLVDVGFGEGATVPIPLVAGNRLPDRGGLVRVMAEGSVWTYQEDRGGGWRVRYAFTAKARGLEDFSEMNLWQQTSPDSRFTQQTICTRLTRNGRITMAGNRLIVTDGDSRTELEVVAADMRAVLRDHFGIRIASGSAEA